MLRLLGVPPGPDIDAYAAANLRAWTWRRPAPARLAAGPQPADPAAGRPIRDARPGPRVYPNPDGRRTDGEARAARDRLLDYYQHDLTAALAGYLLLDGPWPQAAQLHEAAARDARELGEGLASANALCNLSQILRQIGPGQVRAGGGVGRTGPANLPRARAPPRRGRRPVPDGAAVLRPGQTGGRHGGAPAGPAASPGGRRPLAEALIRHALAQCGDLISQREEARLQIGIAVEIYRELDRPQQEAFGLSTLTHLQISAANSGPRRTTAGGAWPSAASTAIARSRRVRSPTSPASTA
jgi:hypothetical protein